MQLRCRCGAVRGEMDTRRAYTRATCYCKDCRAYGRFIGQPGVLDAGGGTDIVAMAPVAVRFTSGSEHIACMSLSPNGLLRWYASCCRTPLGNTPRNPKVPYAGLVTVCFDAAPEAVDTAFGPQGRIVLSAKTATAPVSATPLTFITGGLRIFAGIIGARLRRERATPFFDASGRPLREPEVISRDQRAALEQLDARQEDGGDRL
ncbi:DUF6151 family protein [Lysobacter arenosi]|nr:DUF6151 family protein [Lysobacter arenosi]